MFEPPGPRAPTAVGATNATVMGASPGSLEEPALVQALDVLIWKSDGVRRRIDAIWNDTPEILALLADWDDCLAEQRRDLIEMRQEAGAGAAQRISFGRLGCALMRDLSVSLSPAGRRSRFVTLGHQLLHMQAEAAAATTVPARRNALDRHRTTTARYVNRIDGRQRGER